MNHDQSNSLLVISSVGTDARVLKMFKNTRDHNDPQAKQHGFSEPMLSSTNTSPRSRLFSTLRNPRIVRASRTFGGKDRHSKVTTIRGLRDRRVRLSVPTAIQLYDLQDKLGVNQPSKVVDWLLNAAQHEIDKLPPLQIPPWINFPQSSTIVPRDQNFPQGSDEMFSNDHGCVEDLASLQKSKYWYNKQEKFPREAIGAGNMNMGNSSISDVQKNGMLYGDQSNHWETVNPNIYTGFHSSEEQTLQYQLVSHSTGSMVPYSIEPMYFPTRLSHFQVESSSRQHQ